MEHGTHLPIRFRDRWIDDDDPIELWTTDRSSGLLLELAANRLAPLAAITIHRLPDAASGSAILIVDLASGEVRFQADPGRVVEPPCDVAWLQDQLDGNVRAALQQRLDRQARAFDQYDWKAGDTPRVALGAVAPFAQVFPAAWDLVVTHRGKRYALLDSHRVAEDAEDGPVAIEIVDLDRAEVVGVGEIYLTGARGPAAMWRCTGAVGDPLLMELRQDPDRWYELAERAEIVARAARMMRTWERDLHNVRAVVAELLEDACDEDLLDRVKALGNRCIPALRRALGDPDDETARFAACLLAETGDASGLDQLVATLADPEFDDLGGEADAIVDALGSLGERALEAVLAVATTQDREVQDRLLDALIALDVHDDRIRDLLVGLVRAEPGRATRLGCYGDESSTVVTALVDLLRPRLTMVRDDLEDDDTFDEVQEIVQAMIDLGIRNADLVEFEEIVEFRREALELAMLPDEGPAYDHHPARPAPIRVAPRPGRNEPCWCGSNAKYKKCHLDTDDEAQRSSP